MKSLLVTLLLGAVALSTFLCVTACGGDNSTPTATAATVYDDAAVSHVAAAMIADGELLEPNGAPFSPNDLNTLLAIVKEACMGPGKIQAMVNTLGASPYLLAQAMHLANVGCPKLLADMGIKVGDG